MYLSYEFLFFLAVIELCIVVFCEGKYKLCVPEKNAKYGIKESCQKLDNDEHSLVECVLAKDRLECLRHLNSSLADFTILHPEEIFIANKLRLPIRLTHSLQKYKTSPFDDYNIVGIVSYNFPVSSLSDLKNAKMCSVGFDAENGHDFGWNGIFSKFIEDQVVFQNCSQNLENSLLENRIESIERYFGPSCKAGKWSLDPKQDKMLKQKYPGLCALCDNPITCSNKDKYWGRRGVAYCMTDCLGDVAWMRLDDWKTHLLTTPKELCSEFFYLCPDGRVQLSTESNPCKWVSQPLPAIAVREEIVSSIHYIISDIGVSFPSSDVNTTWLWEARNLVSPFARYIVELDTMYPPNYYLSKVNNYLNSFDDDISCTNNELHAIRFCTQTSSEYSKCQYMSLIATSYGIIPEIKCILYYNCGDYITKNIADIMYVSTDHYANTLSIKPNLKPILFEFNENHRYSVAVVKKSSKIHSFSQLKGKIACFGRYDDFGFNSVVLQLLKEGLLPKICPYEEAIKQYFGDLCVIYSPDNNVIRQCDEHVNPEYIDNQSYIQSEVLECLTIGGGDVAFLDLKNLHTRLEHEWYFKSDSYEYEILCPPNLEKYENLFNNSCYMFWATHGQLLVSTNISLPKQQEIINVMKNIQLYFGGISGKNSGTPSESFKLFETYDGVENVIFQDDSKYLGTLDLQTSKTIKRNFETDVQNYIICDSHRNLGNTDSGTMLSISLLNLVIILISLHSLRLMLS